jgi:pantoate kinase
MAAKPEVKVKAKIKELLKEYNAAYLMPIGTGYGISGVSDFIICYNSKFIAIEAKAGNNKPTPLQQIFLENVRKAGGIAMVINENNLYELEEILKWQ